MLFVDQHEQGGTRFFFPPNADPVNHELPAQALAAIVAVYGPALRARVRARHFAYETERHVRPVLPRLRRQRLDAARSAPPG